MTANLQPITGIDGYIALLNGTALPLGTAGPPVVPEPCAEITTLPGGTLTYPAHQAFHITDRTKKVLDPRTRLAVLNAVVEIPATQYKVLWGAGVILFRTPLTGTPTIAATGAYLPTVTASDVVAIEHVNDWSLNLTANQIPGDEYGTDIAPEYRGKFAGTWQFTRHSSSSGLDLYYLMLLRHFFIFALYEELQSNRIWMVYGDLSASPQNAPSAAMASGTVTGTLKYLPAFLNEPLS